MQKKLKINYYFTLFHPIQQVVLHSSVATITTAVFLNNGQIAPTTAAEPTRFARAVEIACKHIRRAVATALRFPVQTRSALACTIINRTLFNIIDYDGCVGFTSIEF